MSRCDELSARLLDGGLTDAEWAELEALLAADPVAAADHLALLELEAALRGLRTDFDLSESTLARVKDTQAEQTTRAVLAEIASRQPPAWLARPQPAALPHRPQPAAPQRRQPAAAPTPRRSRSFSGLAAGLAVAAALLVGLWLGSTRGPVPPATDPAAPAPEVARLTQAVGAVELLSPLGEVLPAREGGEVPAGHTLRTVGSESLARVELPDHSLVEIEADSVVRFDAGFDIGNGTQTRKPRLFLEAGQLTAAVSDRAAARPLVIGTGVADVLGKTGIFVVSSASPESALVDIKAGQVEVVRRDLSRPLPIDGGSAFFKTGLVKAVIEPGLRTERTPDRSLAFPGAREAVFSPDGNEVWIASSRQLTRWTRDGGTAELSLSPRRNDGPAVFAPDRSVLGTHSGHKDDLLTLWSLPGGEAIGSLDLKLPEGRFRALAPAAEWLALVDPPGNRKRLVVHDGRTGAERFARDFQESVNCLAASPDGRTLAVGLSDAGRGHHNTILLLDPLSGERYGSLPTQKKGITAMTFARDGRHLAAGFNGVIQVWDVRTRELVQTITGFERVVMCLAFAPDATLVAAGTQDGQVWVWSVAQGRPTQRIEVGSRGTRSVAFAPDGRRLVTVAPQAPVSIWNVTDSPSHE